MPESRFPRPWISDRHLYGVATSEAGSIAVHPLRADSIYFDAASSNSLPANLPEGERGSTVLDIGRGVKIRASGNAKRVGDLARVGHHWEVSGSLHGSQYPSRRELTKAQTERARELIAEMITAWAATHEGDIAQADDIDRNNAAHVLEQEIQRHEQALAILREQLDACQEGNEFTRYPDIPTKR